MGVRDSSPVRVSVGNCWLSVGSRNAGSKDVLNYVFSCSFVPYKFELKM